MSTVSVQLQPLGRTLQLAPGTPLREALFPHGVEFPCGGRGRCRNCRIRVTQGHLEETPRDRELLSEEQRAAGWRLACHAAPTSDVTLAVEQWEATILGDDSAVAFVPRAGLGVAIDLGTTTLVAQLLDLSNGCVLAVRTALNPQARYGGDLMSRVEHAVAGGDQAGLVHAVRRRLGRMVDELVAAAHASADDVCDVVLVGNTVMHHLFCDLDLTPLSAYPFETHDDGPQSLEAGTLGWSCAGARVRFVGCLGGFVGSDVLAGALALRMHESEDVLALVDLGTNGEIVVGNREGLLCASTAAGPAFEGARISCGMRAATGAISEVRLEGQGFACSVLGEGEPRGICGSGLVDAVAAGLDGGHILPSGRLVGGAETLPLAGDVSLSQTDIRELQLAKGAIAAGLTILLEQRGAEATNCAIHIAGAFGNYINLGSARRIGLLEYPPERVIAAGNTALRGAKMLLGAADTAAEEAALRERAEHVSLSTHPRFQDIYVEQMLFPEA